MRVTGAVGDDVFRIGAGVEIRETEPGGLAVAAGDVAFGFAAAFFLATGELAARAIAAAVAAAATTGPLLLLLPPC